MQVSALRSQVPQRLQPLRQSPSPQGPEAPETPPPPQPPKRASAGEGALSRLADLGYATSAVPKFIYPTVTGTTEQQAAVWKALDSLPMQDAVRPVSIGVVPSFSQGPNYLGVNRVAVGAIRINAGGYDMTNPVQFNETVVHEVGHSADYKAGMFSMISRQNGSSNGIYGKAPHVSDYAETNPSEDFAESYKVYHTEPRGLERVNSDKFRDMQAREQPHLLEKLVDQDSFRETGKFIGRQFQQAPILRFGLEMARQMAVANLAIGGGSEAISGITRGDGSAIASGLLNAGAGVGMALAPHHPWLGVASAAALGGQRGLQLARQQEAGAARQTLATVAGAVGGTVGGFAAPLALTHAGYSLAGPIGGTVGLLVGGLAGSHLGSKWAAQAALAVTK